MKHMNSPLTRTARTEEDDAHLREFFGGLQKMAAERMLAVEAARPALARLVTACLAKSGQGYKLRAMLFSLWNGKSADLSDTLSLDWALKQDFCAVLLAFGDDASFYDAISDAFLERGLLEWFVEEATR